MFIITDGETKIFGVFDGHGKKGHLVSSFAQSKMIEYITKIKSKFFEQANLQSVDNSEIERKVNHAFKYVQTKLKEQYKKFMVEKGKEKMNPTKMSDELEEGLEKMKKVQSVTPN